MIKVRVSPPPQVSTGGRHGALVFCRRSAELLRCITDRSLRAVMADITEAESPIAGSAMCKPSHLCLLLGSRNTSMDATAQTAEDETKTCLLLLYSCLGQKFVSG